MGESGAQGEPGAQGPQGEIGPSGAVGLSCWDTDEDGECDLDNEDQTQDGSCDVHDCRSPSPILYQRLMTASWLNDHALFGTARSYAFWNDDDGQRVDFTAGSERNEKLFEVPLVQLNDSYSYIVKMRIWADVEPTDNDLIIGISDGLNVTGIVRLDPSNNAFARLLSGRDGQTLVDRLDGAGIGQTSSTVAHHSFDVRFRLSEITETTATGASNVPPLVGIHPRTIDRTGDISLVVFADQEPETYSFRAISVTVYQESI